MFTPAVKLPSGVEVIPYYDTKHFDGTTTEQSFFTTNPNRSDVDNNYVSNPLPGNLNHVILGIKVAPTMYVIEEDSGNNIDPIKIVNQLADGIIRVDVDRGRDEKLKSPLSEFMNLQGIETTHGTANTTDADIITTVTLPASKPVRLDNLFAFGKQESFQMAVKFAEGEFPDAADWTAHGKGRGIGLQVGLYAAAMDDDQLLEYDRRLDAVSG
ncbi:MAG: hypothetical protein ACQETE_01580 [Bacteroidota bacterium]